VIELHWKYRETQDSEFADANHRCFSIQVQDCDGDTSRWHIKRGDQYVAVGEERSVGDVYHLDHAMATAIMVLGYLVKAADLNDFVKNEMPQIKAGTHPLCDDQRPANSCEPGASAPVPQPPVSGRNASRPHLERRQCAPTSLPGNARGSAHD
jgi:hypothetical protein